MNMKFVFTERGFLRGNFLDAYNTPCSIQQSSIIGDGHLWLGCNEGNHIKHDGETMCCARMHIDRDMARALGEKLIEFANTGELKQ